MATKTERLDLRLTGEQRGLIEQAAAISGSTLAGYSIANLVDAAARTVVVDATDAAAAAFYAKHGFKPFPSDPQRLFHSF
jgi:uncharacterized protein (DUF1778 family)